MARSVIVTGAFGVLGTAVSACFGKIGDRVARIDFASAPTESLPGSLEMGGVDLTDEGQARAAIQQVLSAQNGIDVLVNVAGGFTWEKVEGGAAATWQRMYDMNLRTAVTMCSHSMDALRLSENGRIVNVGAGAGQKAGAGMGAYAASKAGVHRLTEALADEFLGSGVTVNAILPSIIDTPANRAEMPEADFSEWVSPAAIAEVIVFLASAEARSITGALIPVTRAG